MNRMAVKGAKLNGIIKNMDQGTQGEGEVKDMNRMLAKDANRYIA